MLSRNHRQKRISRYLERIGLSVLLFIFSGVGIALMQMIGWNSARADDTSAQVCDYCAQGYEDTGGGYTDTGGGYTDT